MPYGMAMWQVGDQLEQNETCKMSLSVKKALFEERLDSFQQDLHLMKTDILPCINKSWPKGFGNVVSNKKVIALCGWVPYSYVLLLDPVLCATMTKEMILWERESSLFPTYIIDSIKNMAYVENNNGTVCFKAIHSDDTLSQTLNFAGGALAQHVATTIICEVDKQKAQGNAQKQKREGTT